jgi:hypothetical protein
MNKEEIDHTDWLAIIAWILSLVFVNMKLVGWITWPWILVFSPMLFYVVLVIAIMVILFMNGY